MSFFLNPGIPPPLSEGAHVGFATGVEGGVLRRFPEGHFGRIRRKWLETAQPMRQKAIQGLLSPFRCSPRPSILDGFEGRLSANERREAPRMGGSCNPFTAEKLRIWRLGNEIGGLNK